MRCWVKTMKKNILFFLITVIFIITSCAQGTKDITPMYTSDLIYNNYTCDQLRAEAIRLNHEMVKTGAVVDEEASADQTQGWVGALLFWPALFWLEGEDTQHTHQYAALLGQYQAIERANIQKQCGMNIQPLPEPVKKELNKSEQFGK